MERKKQNSRKNKEENWKFSDSYKTCGPRGPTQLGSCNFFLWNSNIDCKQKLKRVPPLSNSAPDSLNSWWLIWKLYTCWYRFVCRERGRSAWIQSPLYMWSTQSIQQCRPFWEKNSGIFSAPSNPKHPYVVS